MIISEEYVVKKVVAFLKDKKNGNWRKFKICKLKEHGPDIVAIGGLRNSEYFTIECKGKSYAKKSAKVIDKEGWLNALGQLIQRIDVSRYVKQRGTNSISTINRAYKYGLGLYWVGAQVALRRIPKAVSQALNLYIFAVNDNGDVKPFTPSQFGKEYLDDIFLK